VRAVSLLLWAGIVAGCAGAPPYRSDLPPNLSIKAKLSSPSALLSAPGGSFEADVHVTSVDGRCQKHYRGAVRLGNTPVSVGIPTGEPIYLVFEFSGRFLPSRGSASSTYGTLLTARSGYQYDIDVSYADAMYEISVYERNPRNGARRQVERRPFSACEPKA
jgi:hypothetical protein